MDQKHKKAFYKIFANPQDKTEFLLNLDYKKEIREERPFLTRFYLNLKPGITVGLVNFPLCISLAVAAGATPESGILSGIISGIISGFFGGSNFNIVGPTGALSGFLLAMVKTYGLQSLPFFTFITGVMTFIVSIYHLEKFIDLFPTAVNEGFTVGVAVIILFNQMNPAFGIGKIKENTEDFELKVTSNEQETIIHTIMNNIEHIDQMNPQALLIYLLFVISLYILISKYPLIPWMIISAVIGIIVGMSGVQVETLMSKFGDLKMYFYDFRYVTQPPTLLFLINPRLYVDVIPIAFIAILETLISAKIADTMTGTRFKKQKEMRGLAISNILCGIVGGIPVTAALARTALNIKSGGNHKLAAFINSIILFFLGFFFIKFFKYLPMCVVAAQVSIVAIRMVNFEELQHILHENKTNFFIIITVGSICILRDPTVGIVFGMLIFLIKFCQNLTVPWTEIILKDKQEASTNLRNTTSIDNSNTIISSVHETDFPNLDCNMVIYRMIGIVNFMNAHEHIDKIKALLNKKNYKIVISLRYLYYVDLDAMLALKHLIEKIEKIEKELINENENKDKDNSLEGRRFYITGISQEQIQKVKFSRWINELKANGILILDQQHSNIQSASADTDTDKETTNNDFK